MKSVLGVAATIVCLGYGVYNLVVGNKERAMLSFGLMLFNIAFSLWLFMVVAFLSSR